MKVLITGARGQLGRALIKLKPSDIKIFAMDRSNFNMLDISYCLKTINTLNPDWIINCGAYTNVDLAESDKETAMRINYQAPEAFAQEIKKLGGNFLQISTDYVFSGKRITNSPYLTTEKRSPLGIYGQSKAKAEESLEDIFSDSSQGIILRTSWLMGPVGKNFLITILNLNLKSKEIKVVNDQIGCPTSTISLAKVCWKIIKLKKYNLIFKENRNRILHWQDDGETNWHEIALFISKLSKEYGLIHNHANIIPIKTSQYRSLVERPSYSVLDCELTKNLLNYRGRHWKITLKEILKKIHLDKNNSNIFKTKFKI
ncbi:dTDP-4-dehydrorhamnose reductase [Prochlorococcus sp. AH-716-J09]|nr:dTDP-4-dehydrorhamnose reductase [Prochlorococcus sp. AH-716-J09]